MLHILAFIICFATLISSYYIEYQLLIEPCILCLLQRYIFILLAAIFLSTSIFKLKTNINRYCTMITTCILSLFGLGIASRQIWLQHLPKEKLPACFAGINRMLELYPTTEVLTRILKGSSDCAKIDMELFGFSIAHWSCLIFLVLLIFSILIIFKQKKR